MGRPCPPLPGRHLRPVPDEPGTISDLLADEYVSLGSLMFLAQSGSLSARSGGSPVLSAAWRVTFCGAPAMALTAGVGALFGIVA